MQAIAPLQLALSMGLVQAVHLARRCCRSRPRLTSRLGSEHQASSTLDRPSQPLNLQGNSKSNTNNILSSSGQGSSVG